MVASQQTITLEVTIMIFTTSNPEIPGATWDRWDIVQAYYHYCYSYHTGFSSDEYAKLAKIGTYYSPNSTDQLYLTENAARIYANLVIENQDEASVRYDEIIIRLKEWDANKLWDIFDDFVDYQQCADRTIAIPIALH